MRGKFITTSLQLAVLSGTKKSRKQRALNLKQSMQSFVVIWKKDAVTNHKSKRYTTGLESVYA